LYIYYFFLDISAFRTPCGGGTLIPSQGGGENPQGKIHAHHIEQHRGSQSRPALGL